MSPRRLAPLLLLVVSSIATSSTLTAETTRNGAQTQRVSLGDAVVPGQQLMQQGAQTERVSIPSELVPGQNLMQHGTGKTSRTGGRGAPSLLSHGMFALALVLAFCATVASASSSMLPSPEEKEAPTAQLYQLLGLQRSAKLQKVEGLQDEDEAESTEGSDGSLIALQRRASAKESRDGAAPRPRAARWSSMSASLLGLQRSVRVQKTAPHDEDEASIDADRVRAADGALLGLQRRVTSSKVVATALTEAEPQMEDAKTSAPEDAPVQGVWLYQGRGVVTKTDAVFEDTDAGEAVQAAAEAKPQIEGAKMSTEKDAPVRGVWLQRGRGVVTKTGAVVEDNNAGAAVRAATDAEPHAKSTKESAPVRGIWLQQGRGVVTKTDAVQEDHAGEAVRAAALLGTQTAASLTRRRGPLEEYE